MEVREEVAGCPGLLNCGKDVFVEIMNFSAMILKGDTFRTLNSLIQCIWNIRYYFKL